MCTMADDISTVDAGATVQRDLNWWSRGELNPRPRVLCRQFYMCIRLILRLTVARANRQALPWRFTRS